MQLYSLYRADLHIRRTQIAAVGPTTQFKADNQTWAAQKDTVALQRHIQRSSREAISGAPMPQRMKSSSMATVHYHTPPAKPRPAGFVRIRLRDVLVFSPSGVPLSTTFGFGYIRNLAARRRTRGALFHTDIRSFARSHDRHRCEEASAVEFNLTGRSRSDLTLQIR